MRNRLYYALISLTKILALVIVIGFVFMVAFSPEHLLRPSPMERAIIDELKKVKEELSPGGSLKIGKEETQRAKEKLILILEKNSPLSQEPLIETEGEYLIVSLPKNTQNEEEKAKTIGNKLKESSEAIALLKKTTKIGIYSGKQISSTGEVVVTVVTLTTR